MNNVIFDKYVDEVCNLFSIKKEELFSKVRTKHVVEARQMVFYLCYNRPMGLNLIKSYTLSSGLNIAHTSILHGIRSIGHKRSVSRDYDSAINRIERAVTI